MSFVTEIHLDLAPKMRADLAGQGFEMSHPPHTLFAAKKPGLSCTLYQSGKLVVQGKEKKEFIEFYLEPEILGSFEFTNPAATVDRTERIGCDEAGKGDFFGPLCVAGVHIDEKSIDRLIELKIADSKKIADTRILTLAKEIIKICSYEVLVLNPVKYNELYQKFGNLNSMLGWAHATIIDALVHRTKCKLAIVDQFANERLLQGAVARKQVEVELVQRVRGESDLAVAAGSILARAAFVRGIERLEKEFNVSLPKGAASHVITAGKRVVSKLGAEMLPHVGKMHFKTATQVLC